MAGQPLQNGIMRGVHLTIVFGLTLFTVGTSINAFLLRLLQGGKYQVNDIAHTRRALTIRASIKPSLY